MKHRLGILIFSLMMTGLSACAKDEKKESDPPKAPTASVAATQAPTEAPTEAPTATPVTDNKEPENSVEPFSISMKDGAAVLTYDLRHRNNAEEYDNLQIFLGGKRILHLWMEENDEVLFRCECEAFPELETLVERTVHPFTDANSGRLVTENDSNDSLRFCLDEYTFEVTSYESHVDLNVTYDNKSLFGCSFYTRDDWYTKGSYSYYTNSQNNYKETIYHVKDTPDGAIEYLASETTRKTTDDGTESIEEITYYDNGKIKTKSIYTGEAANEDIWVEYYSTDGEYIGKATLDGERMLDKEGNNLLRWESLNEDRYELELYFADHLLYHLNFGEWENPSDDDSDLLKEGSNPSCILMGHELYPLEQALKSDDFYDNGWGIYLEYEGKEYECNGIWPKIVADIKVCLFEDFIDYDIGVLCELFCEELGDFVVGPVFHYEFFIPFKPE